MSAGIAALAVRRRAARTPTRGAAWGSLLFLALLAPDSYPATRVTAARIWPSPDYTRVTLEAEAPLKFSAFALKNPERVVLDLEDAELTSALTGLPAKIGTDDAYVKALRIGRPRPGVVRLVFDLKAELRHQAFAIAPVGDYGHRLVLDLHPLEPPDPLLALLEQLEVPRAPPGAKPAEAAPAQEAAPPKGGAAPTRPRAAAQPLIIVAVDAGHGGEDPGAKGRGGTYEKDVTLAIARKLKARIDREPNMRALLIRDGDYYIPLHARVAKARRARADLFVSIHADAFIRPHARGSSVFALSESGATSTAASWLAKRENDADLIGGVNLDLRDRYLAMTLADLSLTAQINDSLKVGRAVLDELGGINALHKGYVEQAGFAVLKAPDIPSILVETAFISNPEEERKLRSEAYQEKIAEAIFSGIRRYFANHPPLVRERLVANP